jgi:hypothetical protein
MLQRRGGRDCAAGSGVRSTEDVMDLITVGNEQFVRIGSDLINERHIERIALDECRASLASG